MGEKRKDNIDDITKKMKKQKKDKNLKNERSELGSDVVTATDKTNELPPKDEPKKFHISLKMQSSLTMEKPQPVEGKKGPKIIIAKSKKEKDDESKKPTKRLNKVSLVLMGAIALTSIGTNKNPYFYLLLYFSVGGRSCSRVCPSRRRSTRPRARPRRSST